MGRCSQNTRIPSPNGAFLAKRAIVCCCPVRADRWSPYEIALFESAICLVGKHFSHIAAVVRTKSTAECIEFYYVWKKGNHYPTWKATYKQHYGDYEFDT